MRKEEKETIIEFNQAERMAHAVVYDRKFMKRIERRAATDESVRCIYDGDGFREYIFPADILTVTSQKKLSEEERAKRAQRLAKSLEQRRQKQNGDKL